MADLLRDLEAQGWQVSLVARAVVEIETASDSVPRSITVLPAHNAYDVARRLLALARTRDTHVLTLMPSLLAAAATIAVGRRAVMYAGAAWGTRDDFSKARDIIEQVAARRARAVVVAGIALQQHFKRCQRPVELESPHLHPHVRARLQRPPEHDARAAEPRVLFVGGSLITRLKGICELAGAVARLRHVELHVVGRFETPALAAEVRARLRASRVHYHGFLPWPRLARLYETCDILVLPSHTEGFPRVLYEAAAYGLAIVVTPVGGVPHVLVDGVHARFVPVGDVAALAAAIQELLVDAPARQAMAEAGRVRLAAALPPESPAEQFSRLLRARDALAAPAG